MAAIRPIYLDYQATTPVDARVMSAMTPFFTEAFGNPHSSSHAFGWEARDAVEVARGQVANMINADPREIVFTSGATESNNMAIKGVGRFFAGRKNHMIASVTEHKCVLESIKYMARNGVEVTWLRVDGAGMVDPDDVRRALRADTALVSIMLAHNETGVVQPLSEIGEHCRAAGAYLHTDAAQAAGKMPLDVAALNVDLMSISAHKMYAPMGVGALYVRRKPRVRLEPLFDGGGQERTLRSGTLPAPLLVGFGEAARIASDEIEVERKRVRKLRDDLLTGLQRHVAETFVNGDMQNRLDGNLNIGFNGIDSESLMEALTDQVAISSGSACTSASVEPSYVLRAMGLSDQHAHASIRVCVGRMTTSQEIETAITAIAHAVNTLRSDGSSRASVTAA